MDALSKVTGESRKAMEDQMEAARSEERFAAKLQELRSQGPEGIAAAKELELTNLMLAKENKQLAQGFRDASTGMITTEAAQKAMLVTQGQVMVQSDKLSNGLVKAGQAATVIGQTAGATAKAMTPLAKAGAYFGSDYAADLRSGLTDYNKALTEAEIEQSKQGAKGGKAADAAVQAQTDLRLAQQKGNEATERFVFAGIVPATKAMETLAKTTTAGVESLNKLFGITPSTETSSAPLGPEFGGEQGGGAAPDVTAVSASGGLSGQLEADEKLKKLPEYEKTLAEIEKYQTLFNEGNKLNEKQLEGFKARSEIAAKAVADYNKKFAAKGAPAGGGASPAVGGGAAPAAPASAAPASAAKAVPTGPSGPQGEAAPPVAPKTAQIISFGSGSGSQQNFAGLDDKLENAVTKAAEQYNATTGNKIQINSAKRDSDKQKELYDAWIAGGKKGMPVAAPGTSLHEKGLAVDIQNYNDPAAVAAMNQQGLKQKVPNDPVHFSFDRGGILKGPETGYKPNLTLHGEEAFIPLKDGAVPVSLNLKDALNTPTFGGYNEYAGVNQGPMSTDLDAVKKIAAAAGAFDRATETITNPEMWKQVLSSGLATNYQLGAATLGTKGLEGLGDDIAERLKEIREQSGADSTAALQQVSSEFREAMAQMSQQLAGLATKQNETGMGDVTELLSELISATKTGVGVQQKILASNY